MRLVKAAVRTALERMGYRVSRIATRPNGDANSGEPAKQRRVANAFYKGHCFKCFLDDYLGESILTGRGWDRQFEAILDDLVSRGRSGDILEIGANIGASLIPIAAKYPGHTFHCVEPVPEFYSLLEANLESYGPKNVRLYPHALASENDKPITIHTQMGTAGAIPEYWHHTHMGTFEVRALTADALFGTADVKLVKLDVDGYELEVLRGAAGIFARQRPPCFLEFATELMRMTAVDPNDVTAFFERLGYNHVTVYYDGKLLKTNTSLAELVAIADSVPYYVDALIEKRHSDPES